MSNKSTSGFLAVPCHRHWHRHGINGNSSSGYVPTCLEHVPRARLMPWPVHAHYAKSLGSLPALSFSGRQPSEAAQLPNFRFHDLANDIITETLNLLNRRNSIAALPNQHQHHLKFPRLPQHTKNTPGW